MQALNDESGSNAIGCLPRSRRSVRAPESPLRFCGTRLEAQVALSDFECSHKLASLGLADAFDAIYAGERLGHPKPSPEPFKRVLRDLDLPPHCLLHIGDRPSPG